MDKVKEALELVKDPKVAWEVLRALTAVKIAGPWTEVAYTPCRERMDTFGKTLASVGCDEYRTWSASVPTYMPGRSDTMTGGSRKELEDWADAKLAAAGYILAPE